MLLIAEPKSGSTSLLWSIAEILKIQRKNGQNRLKSDIKCIGFEEMQKYHNTTVKRSKEFLKKYIESKDIIYKEHILPTKEHLKYLGEIGRPVVVLLRNSTDIIESYKRVFSVLPDIKKMIDLEKMKKELDLFYYLYNKQRNTMFLKVHYEDIVLNFHATIKKILSQYGFNIPMKEIKKYQLQKRNFGGHGLRKLKNRSQNKKNNV
jgi:hypothetical protein